MSDLGYTRFSCNYPELNLVQYNSSAAQWTQVGDFCSTDVVAVIPDFFYKTRAISLSISCLFMAIFIVQTTRKILYLDHPKQWLKNHAANLYVRMCFYCFCIVLISANPTVATWKLYTKWGSQFIAFWVLYSIVHVAWTVIFGWVRLLMELISYPTENLKKLELAGQISAIFLVAFYSVPTNSTKFQTIQHLVIALEFLLLGVANFVYGCRVIYVMLQMRAALKGKAAPNSKEKTKHRTIVNVLVLVWISFVAAMVYVINRLTRVVSGFAASDEYDRNNVPADLVLLQSDVQSLYFTSYIPEMLSPWILFCVFLFAYRKIAPENQVKRSTMSAAGLVKNAKKSVDKEPSVLSSTGIVKSEEKNTENGSA